MATNKKVKKTKNKKSTTKVTRSVAKKVKASSKKPSVAKKLASKKPSKSVTLKKAVKTKTTPKAALAKSKPSAKKATKPKATVAKKATAKASVAKVASAKKPSKPQGPKGKAWLLPLDDRILVEIAEMAPVSPGGIILVDSSYQPENVHGHVIAVGRGHQSKKGRIRPTDVKVGDKIIFSKYAGDKVSHDGVNFVIIRETEVLGFASN